METVTFKVDEGLAKEMEKAMQHNHYTTKTEFIRDAIREKMSKLRDMQHLLSIYGKSRRKTTDKQLHEARERAFKEISRRLS